jgi:hypothetical protein
MTLRKNTAIPRSGYKRSEAASLSPGHFKTPDVQAAQKAVAEVLKGGGTPLGSGNFGAVYAVALGDTPLIVKLGTRDTIHSRGPYGRRSERRRTGSVEEVIKHEAGICNLLWGRGFRCIPATVYAQHKGVVALVREYGEIIADGAESFDKGARSALTLPELDALAAQLVQVIEVGGVAIHDNLLVARRVQDSADGTARKGSLFVADAGVWSVMRGSTEERRNAYDDLWMYLGKVAPRGPYPIGAPSLSEIEYLRAKVNAIDPDDEDDDNLLQKLRRKSLNGAIARRAQVPQ